MTAQTKKGKSIWDREIASRAIWDSFAKLNPRTLMKNPVMFVVEVGAALLTIQLVRNTLNHTHAFAFEFQITIWLWFTVLFANFAEAMAEGRGKAQADTLRKARTETVAHKLQSSGCTQDISGSKLRSGDVVVVSAGEFIPGDGEVIEGVASVDESAITGESAPVIRESGGDRSAVTGGTRVLSDEIKVRITSNPGETFLDRMIKLVEGASRQKTPNEIALNILLAGLTIIFLLAVVTLQPFAIYSGAPQSIFVLVSLLVCLIPTTIGGLLSAIGIAGMDRMIQRNVIAMSGRAVEAAGGALHCGAGKRQIRTPRPRVQPAQSSLHSVLRADPHVRRRPRWPANSQGSPGRHCETCRRARQPGPQRNSAERNGHFERRRHAAVGRAKRTRSRRHRPNRYRQRRNARAL